jgi:uncharacterized membrane protein YeiB
MPEQSPTLVRQRLYSLDLMRGFAVLVILVIDMRYFAMPMGELGNPAFPDTDLYGNFSWWFGDILQLYALCGLVVVWFRKLPANRLADYSGLGFHSVLDRRAHGSLSVAATLSPGIGKGSIGSHTRHPLD